MSEALAAAVTRSLAELGPTEMIVGTFVTTNADGTVQIDFGQGEVTVLSAINYQPLPGIAVRCLRYKGGAILLGESNPIAILGTVTATGTPLLTVETSAGEKQLPYLVSYTPRTIGDIVVIFGGYVLGEPSAALGANYTPETPAASSYSVDFRADDSGSYFGSSWWTNDVRCSDGNIGAWFYGSTIANTIPDAATITRVQIYINEYYNQFPSSLATIGLHTLETKSGAPTVTDTVTISAGSGWKDLPASFGDALKTGAKKGAGTNEGGFHKFRSRAADADSGLLRIDWSI